MIRKKGIAILLLSLVFFILNLSVHQPAFANEDKKEPSVADILEQNGEVDAKQEREVTPLTEESKEESPGAGSLIIKLMFYTLLIIGLIYLIRKMVSQQKNLNKNQLFNHLGATSLGNNKTLQLVQVGGKIYLLGVADQVSLIKEINEENEIKVIESNLAEAESVISKGLIDLIQSKLNNKNQTGPTNSFQDLFKQSMENQLQKRRNVELDIKADESNHKEGRSM